MFYVVLDLEWNNSYSKKNKGFVNEIIEIGAVIVNKEFEVIDTFSVFIKSQLSRKLTTRVKKLTNISNEDIRTGLPFSKAFSEFSKWLGVRDHIILTWGDADIRVLIDNYKYFNGIEVVPFLKKYIDLQKYFQQAFGLSGARQIGLTAAAELCNIDSSEYSAHRALEDSLLELRCLKKTFDKDKINESIVICDRDFYQRLKFKVQNITNLNNPKIDKSLMVCYCDVCNSPMKRLSEWKCVNQSFRALFICNKCVNMSLFSIRFREYYDRVAPSITYTKIKKAENNKKL